ncbi:polar amino acid transport system substrate-binding protein [Paraburkholderia susongensis]|uniref:Polar amino acid transport system substrate-binding protein n=2 Tax=Paraburkholderia susongensis TaxID=1515439 RepID=A0A1X7LJI8_9BURK|nr:polar amino acid transport system substrate-binding protein [Paraburkholderia susongensis]
MLKKNGFKAISAISLACAAFLGLIGSAHAENNADGFVINSKISKAALNPAAVAALPSDIKEKGVLTIGGETTLPPYLYREDGGITGIEADFMQALGQALGVRIKVINTDFGSMVIGLTSGRLDVAMSDFSDTPEREKQVTFVDYTKTGQQLIVAKGNPRNIHSVADLCGTTAGGPVGSLSLAIAQRQSDSCTKAGKPAVTVQGYPSASASDLALRTGRIDAMGIDYAIAANIVKASAGKAELTGDLFESGFHGAAVGTKNAQLAKALQLAFEGISKQGIDKQILDFYGVPQMRIDNPVINAMQGKN